MPSSSDKEKLLEDLLRDANYEAFRAEVFEMSRAEFQARRRARSRVVYFALAASVAILGTLLGLSGVWRGAQKPVETAASRPADALVFQRDQIPVITLIESRELAPVDVVRSFPDRSLLVSTPVRQKIDLVYSDASTVSTVNDAELLALFPNETVGFVKTARGKKLVVIAGTPVNFQFPFARKAVR